MRIHQKYTDVWCLCVILILLYNLRDIRVFIESDLNNFRSFILKTYMRVFAQITGKH